MQERLSTFSYWALWVGVAFFSIYPTANWLTSQRDGLFHLYISEELAIPFVPQLIWAYLSMYVLFLMPPLFLEREGLTRLGKQLIAGTIVSGIIFLLFPATLGFQRAAPDIAPYDQIFAAMFSVDHPHNLVPSLHVVFSASIILAILESVKGWVYALFSAWLITIVASTVLVHQHHLLDVIAALGLTFLLRNRFRRET